MTENKGDTDTTNENRLTIFKWTISNYEEKFNTVIKSDTFTMANNQDIEWRLLLNVLRHDLHDIDGFRRYPVSLHLELCKSVKSSVSFDVSCSVLNETNDKVFTRNQISCKLQQWPSYYGFTEFCFANLLKSFLVNGDLKIICEIKHRSDLIIENFRLLKGYKSFINNQSFSDVTLYLGEEKIYAHRIILATQSPVFNRMFTTDMVESKTNEATVRNIDLDVFTELLRYMYTGRVERLDELALKIFKAAHFYQIYDLLKICEQILKVNVSVENAIESLKLADDYEAKKMKDHCIAFILENFKIVMKSADLKGLIKSHPHLPFELLIEMGSK